MMASVNGRQVQPRPAAATRAAPRRLQSTAAPPQPAGRPRVDFLDPLLRHAALQAKGIGITSFLIALAAFQRGLKVTFHYEFLSSDPRFASTRLQGYRGELFSISNGSRSHAFSLSMGDLTDLSARAVAQDKHRAKVALRKAGVRVPEGIVVSPSQGALIEAFTQRHAGKRFVVKPSAGSLARGVEADLAAAEVLAAARRQAGRRIIIEEFIAGTEFRATVVGGRCVGVSQRTPASVTGDGRSTIADLVTMDNKVRASHPHLAELADMQAIAAYLGRSGLTLASIPEAGRTVQLINTAYAGVHADVTDTVAEVVKAVSVKAVLACGLPNGGVDLILTEVGEVAVLEVNERSWIAQHSFPREGHGRGNAVAEAIVDLYFPETVGNPTNAGLTFDFSAVRAALHTAQLAEVSLPVIGPGWRVLRVSGTGATVTPMVNLIESAALASGVFMAKAPVGGDGVIISLAAAPTNFNNFLNLLPPPFRARMLSHPGASSR